MLILILGLLLVTFIVFLVLRIKYPLSHKLCPLASTMSNVLVAIFFIIIVIGCVSIAIAYENCIDSKIAMYQEENRNIEQDIDKIVKTYSKHKHDTFADLKTKESSITLLQQFPELKSNTLVKQLLKIYIANNTKIVQLREEKSDIPLKWILYFGK